MHAEGLGGGGDVAAMFLPGALDVFPFQVAHGQTLFMDDFPGFQLLLDQGADNVRHVGGLGQILDGPPLHGADHGGNAGIAGEDEDAGLGRAGQQGLDEVEARLSGQIEIQDDVVGRLFLAANQGFRGRGHGGDLKTPPGEGTG